MELVKELQAANDSLSKQSVDYDHQLSDLKEELQMLQDTIATLRESVGTKDSELKVRVLFGHFSWHTYSICVCVDNVNSIDHETLFTFFNCCILGCQGMFENNPINLRGFSRCT